MAKNEDENLRDDESRRKIKLALTEVCLLQLDDVKNKRAKNPETVINSAIAIYTAIK